MEFDKYNDWRSYFGLSENYFYFLTLKHKDDVESFRAALKEEAPRRYLEHGERIVSVPYVSELKEMSCNNKRIICIEYKEELLSPNQVFRKSNSAVHWRGALEDDLDYVSISSPCSHPDDIHVDNFTSYHFDRWVRRAESKIEQLQQLKEFELMCNCL